MQVFINVLVYFLTIFLILYFIINIFFKIWGKKTKCPKCDTAYNVKDWNFSTKRLGGLKTKQKQELAKAHNKLIADGDLEYINLIDKK